MLTHAATTRAGVTRPRGGVSIRAACLRTRRLACRFVRARRLRVSIRAACLRTRRPRSNVAEQTPARFQSAPRAYARGDHARRAPAHVAAEFQSAPRAYARGDSGHVQRHGRRALLHVRRERGEFKPQLAAGILSKNEAHIGNIEAPRHRERPVSRPALGVRGPPFTGSAARSNPPVWRRHDAPCAPPPFHPESKNAANLPRS